MAYTNSPLATVKVLSPNHSGQRNHKIDTITIHCVVGQCSAQRIGEIFLPKERQASSNYGIGYDGQIGLYVEEQNRSWCSSSASNDHRAITIEVASDTTHPYAVNDKAYAALLDLVTDICKRNGITKLLWQGDKNLIGQVDKQNMTVHRWFANKSCPGDYLYNKHGEIAAEVNKRLAATQTPAESTDALYRVQTGAFAKKANADALAAELKAKGFDTYIVQVGGLYKVQVGAYKVKTNATAMLNKIKAAGYDAFITVNANTAPAPAEKPAVAFSVGDRVKCNTGVKTFANGGKMASWVPTATLYVRAVEQGGKILLVSTEKTKKVYTGRVNASDVHKI